MKHRTRASDAKTAKGLGSKINYREQNKLSKQELSAGNTSRKVAIPLSDGKTIVFANKGKNIDEVKEYWERKINTIVLDEKDSE